MNHNDTSTGKLSGWSPWTIIPSSDSSTTSHTFTGLTAGKEYRYKIRAVTMVEGQDDMASKPAPSAKPWYVSATAAGPTPPPPVSKLWVDRVCDHQFIVWWERVSGATGYDLEMRGKNWKRMLTNKNYNGFQFSQWTKDATFRFRIRSVNAHGESEWRKVKSVAPPCAVEGLRASYASNGNMTVSWNAAKRADGYDVNFSADNGRSWQRMVSSHSATAYTFKKEPQALPYNPEFLAAVQSRKGGLSGGWRNAPIARFTVSGVKATAATLNMDGHSGDWRFKQTAPSAGDCTAGSGASHNLTELSPGTAHSFTAYWDGSCADVIGSVTFTTPASLTVSDIERTSATLNLAGHNGQWWYDADTGPHSVCQGPVAAGTSSADLTGLTEHQQYTYKAYSATDCNDTALLASITFEPSGDVLTAESVTATTATLKLENHTGGWWFKRTAPDAGSCTAGESDFTNALAGLVPGTAYTYKSYDVDSCGDSHEGASVDFTTGGVSVSNFGDGTASLCNIGNIYSTVEQCAVSFNAGNTAKAPNGYTLHSVTAKFALGAGSPSGFNIALHEESGGKPGSAVANTTLSGDAPANSGNSTRTYTCSGTGNTACQLEAGDTYFIVATAPDSTGGINVYQWIGTSSTSEIGIPSDNGWSIGDTVISGSTWGGSTPGGGYLKVSATVNSD